MIGIYKITNPKGLIYIGKSKDINRRWRCYKLQLAKSQPKLNASFLSYGFNNHKFEVLCECLFHELHNKEAYFIDFYNSTTHLNCANVNYSNKIRIPKSKLSWQEYLKNQLLKTPNKQSFKKDMSVASMAQRKINNKKAQKKRDYNKKCTKQSTKTIVFILTN